jgi:hypothetical protein
MGSRKEKEKEKNTAYATVLLSECPEEHNECMITYYKGGSRMRELCMCRCHSHVKPPIREPEPILGIAALKDIH